VSPGCIISGAHVQRSILAPAVQVHSWATVDQSVIGEGCDIGRRARVRRAILDKFVTIADGAVVGFDPEHDRARGLNVGPTGLVAIPKGHHVPA
jgi:glucose-1-phosphate adenylyltransferase